MNDVILKAGMMVDVYEDPYTCVKLEGRAKLTRVCSYTSDLPRWWVKWPDGELTDRAINPETINQEEEGTPAYKALFT